MKKIVNEQAPSAPSKEFFSVACPPPQKKRPLRKVFPTRRVTALPLIVRPYSSSKVSNVRELRRKSAARAVFPRPLPLTDLRYHLLRLQPMALYPACWLIFPHVSWYSKCITNRLEKALTLQHHLGFANLLIPSKPRAITSFGASIFAGGKVSGGLVGVVACERCQQQSSITQLPAGQANGLHYALITSVITTGHHPCEIWF